MEKHVFQSVDVWSALYGVDLYSALVELLNELRMGIVVTAQERYACAIGHSVRKRGRCREDELFILPIYEYSSAMVDDNIF